MRKKRFHGGMGLVVLSSVVSFANAAEKADAAPGGDGPVELEVFKGPKLISRKLFYYPDSAYNRRQEGWVHVNMMVDPKGKPYEVAIVESSGNETLDRVAVEVMERWIFEPAMLGDRPVDAAFSYKLTFSIDSVAKGASSKFIERYKRLILAIAADDRAAADTEMAKLEVNNLYEDAYSNIAHYQYHVKWGTETQQRKYLQRAIAGETAPRFLPEDMFIVAVRSLLALQLRTKDFANALRTWEMLQKYAPKDNLDKYKQTMADVERLRTSDESYTVPGEIDNGTSWFYTLFKNRFYIDVASGRVAEIKLRCDKRYVFFRYEPGLEYRISDRYGSCGLELVGDHGTQFSLTQS